METICLPVDSREIENTFGNFVGRIDISRKSIEMELDTQNQAVIINKYIKAYWKTKMKFIKAKKYLI